MTTVKKSPKVGEGHEPRAIKGCFQGCYEVIRIFMGYSIHS